MGNHGKHENLILLIKEYSNFLCHVYSNCQQKSFMSQVLKTSSLAGFMKPKICINFLLDKIRISDSLSYGSLIIIPLFYWSIIFPPPAPPIEAACKSRYRSPVASGDGTGVDPGDGTQLLPCILKCNLKILYMATSRKSSWA